MLWRITFPSPLASTLLALSPKKENNNMTQQAVCDECNEPVDVQDSKVILQDGKPIRICLQHAE